MIKIKLKLNYFGFVFKFPLLSKKRYCFRANYRLYSLIRSSNFLKLNRQDSQNKNNFKLVKIFNNKIILHTLNLGLVLFLFIR